jgi:hypothetical protein
MAKPAPKSQDVYLHDMLEAARLIHGYLAGVGFDEFWHNPKGNNSFGREQRCGRRARLAEHCTGSPALLATKIVRCAGHRSFSTPY